MVLNGQEAVEFLHSNAEGYEPVYLDEDQMVLERGLDLQTHLRFPGQEQKETLDGGLCSAFVGGYDSVVAMPNTNPYLDEAEILSNAIKQFELHNKTDIRAGFTAAGTKGLKGLDVTDIKKLKENGAVAITDDGFGVEDNKAMEEIFKACQEYDLLFMQHAERPGHGGHTPSGPFQKKYNIPVYPDDAESWMVERDVKILRKYPKARYHVLHVTTKKSVEVIARAKEEGLRVTAEVSPHHLMFSCEEIPDESNPNWTHFKMNPPLFRSEDRQALRKALREGIIDCISTDHAPHSIEEKSKNWIEAPFGTRGLETCLSVLTTLAHQGEISWEKIEDYFSRVPRKIIKNSYFENPRGFVVIDRKNKWKVSHDDLPGISKNSIFIGSELKGRPVAVLNEFYHQLI